ncbi:fungal-specific transcription factor domain-containing protein [Xylariales sp. AK1849]|nr:fungal-specific transcription factor domain-containing protein [Xylariales sp. AK1849]
MGKCWTCRRRRLKCDETFPYCQKCQLVGVQCLGYEKPLTWVGGIASRGRMQNQTFDIHPPPPVSTQPLSERRRPQTREITFVYGPTRTARVSQDALSRTSNSPSAILARGDSVGVALPSLSQSLTDPIFQGLSQDTRFFIEYFERRLCLMNMIHDDARNPYREMIPLIGSSTALIHAIIAFAACNLMQSTTKYPIFSTTGSHHLDASTSRLLKRFIVSKHQALRQLSNILSNRNERQKTSTLATVVLLMVLECHESGQDSWTIHLEGAKQLLNDGTSNANFCPSGVYRSLINEILLLETFGYTLARPGSLRISPATRLMTFATKEEHVTCVGCPREILHAINLATSQRRFAQPPGFEVVHSPTCADIESLQATLRVIRSFDVDKWISDMIAAASASYSVSRGDLTVVCRAWKRSAEIYTCRVLYQLTKELDLPGPRVEDQIRELTFLEGKDILMKCLLWPIFIAGAECNRPEQRAWVLQAFDRIWSTTFSANTKNAALVLTGLWRKQDLARDQLDSDEPSTWDWMTELSSFDTHWLFA